MNQSLVVPCSLTQGEDYQHAVAIIWFNYSYCYIIVIDMILLLLSFFLSLVLL